MTPNRGKTTDRITIERVYPSTLEDVWAFWTTREGIESWWGPDGFQSPSARSTCVRAGSSATR